MATPTPTAMIAPISDSTLSVVCVNTSIHSTPASAPGTASRMISGIKPRLKIRRHQQIHQHDCQRQPAVQAQERLPHRGALAQNLDAGAGRSVPDLVDIALNVGADAAEIAPFDRAIEIDDALHRVVVDSLRLQRVADAAQVGERNCGDTPDAPGGSGSDGVIGVRPSACTEFTRCCGVCTATA